MGQVLRLWDGVVTCADMTVLGEWVSSALMCCMYISVIYRLLISLQDSDSGWCCIPFRSCYWPEMMSVLLRLGALPLAVSKGCGCQLEVLQSFMGTSVCAFDWTQIDGERSMGAR